MFAIVTTIECLFDCSVTTLQNVVVENAGKSADTKIWGNRILKCVYKMAAHAALKGDSGLRTYYDALRARGLSHHNASNAVSRKIAAVSLSLWKHQKKYEDKMMMGGLAK